MDPNLKDFPGDFSKHGKPPTAEEVAKIVENHPELHKPLFFANHQKKFVAFTWLMCIRAYFLGFAFYGVFFQKYPQEEHVFSPIRRYVEKLKDKFFTVNTEQDEVIQSRIKELQEKLEAKKSEIADPSNSS
eukprot:gene18230-20048_t